jgi:hypothetical protein
MDRVAELGRLGGSGHLLLVAGNGALGEGEGGLSESCRDGAVRRCG